MRSKQEPTFLSIRNNTWITARIISLIRNITVSNNLVALTFTLLGIYVFPLLGKQIFVNYTYLHL